MHDKQLIKMCSFAWKMLKVKLRQIFGIPDIDKIFDTLGENQQKFFSMGGHSGQKLDGIRHVW